MKIGTLAYVTEQGLGILAKSFYDNGILTDVGIVKHGFHQNHYEWYPNNPVINSYQDACAFISNLDVILFFETPFYWKLIPYCRERGIKTILMPMYECTKCPFPYVPDKILCPSELEASFYGRGTFIPIPVQVPWKLRTTAHIYVHNAGNGSIRSRNGTVELVEAMKLVKNPIKLILRAQNQRAIEDLPSVGNNIDLRIGTVPYSELWEEGDIFIFPEKFNGLSLPLQEAYASGMLVLASDRYPINCWLPKDGLIPIVGEQDMTMFAGAPRVKEAIVDPQRIADMMDRWYDQDISEYSLQGHDWSQTMSWEVLRPAYEDFIRS